MNELINKLLNCQNVSNEREYILELAEMHSVPKIITELESMLQSDESMVIAALFFLRQVSISTRNDKKFNAVVKRFRKKIPSSKIFALMEKLLYSPNAGLRSRTIYTFGKMLFSEQKSVLENAIQFYIDQSPSQLGELLFEYFWLHQGVDIALLKDLINRRNPVVIKAIEWYLEHTSEQDRDIIKKEIGL